MLNYRTGAESKELASLRVLESYCEVNGTGSEG
jgi:hypothetical protein